MDKTITSSFYEVEIDPETVLPVRIHITVLTGRKGEDPQADTKAKGKDIVGGEHVAFHFEYTLSKYGKPPQPLKIPREASKLLAKR